MLITLILFISFFSTHLYGGEIKLRSKDYKTAMRYGFSKSQIKDEFEQTKRKIDIEKINKAISKKLLSSDFERSELVDLAIFNMMNKINSVLIAENHEALANEIKSEYEANFKNYLTKQLIELNEIGDHEPLSEWLDSVHLRIHDTLGDFICKYFRFHDIFILNYSIPVVFNPKSYDLKDYKDHFSGHLIWGFFWEHHGFAGVVTYWIIEGICIAGSYGLGVITFVCSPIASFAEHVMDKRIAPPIAENIWQRSQHHY